MRKSQVHSPMLPFPRRTLREKCWFSLFLPLWFPLRADCNSFYWISA